MKTGKASTLLFYLKSSQSFTEREFLLLTTKAQAPAILWRQIKGSLTSSNVPNTASGHWTDSFLPGVPTRVQRPGLFPILFVSLGIYCFLTSFLVKNKTKPNTHTETSHLKATAHCIPGSFSPAAQRPNSRRLTEGASLSSN